jgi:hypothetical protein
MPDNTAQFISAAWSGMFADAEATMRQSHASKFWDAKAHGDFFPEGGQAQAHLARLQAAGEAFLLLPQGLFPTMQQGFAMQQKPAFQFHQPAPTAAALLPPPNFPPPPSTPPPALGFNPATPPTLHVHAHAPVRARNKTSTNHHDKPYSKSLSHNKPKSQPAASRASGDASGSQPSRGQNGGREDRRQYTRPAPSEQTPHDGAQNAQAAGSPDGRQPPSTRVVVGGSAAKASGFQQPPPTI